MPNVGATRNSAKTVRRDGCARGLDAAAGVGDRCALRELAARLSGTPVVAFDVGCFPWHGSDELSVLTADELDSDSDLQSLEELAAWFHYNFTVGLSSWDAGTKLGRQKGEAYRSAD